MTTPPPRDTTSYFPTLKPGNLPVIRPGTWHSLPAYGAQVSSNVPTGRMFALPMWPGRRCLMTGMAVNVTLALAGGNIRMGLYAGANGLPSVLLGDFGTVASGVLGVQQITTMKSRLDPKLYFLVVGRQGGVLNLGLASRETWDPLVSETTPTLAGSLNSYYIDGVAGALPAQFGVPTGTAQGPAASVRIN